MFTRLFLLFTVVPAVEFYLLIQLGQLLGAGPTVALILLTGVLGASMARTQGLAVLQGIQAEAAQGFPSGERIVEGLLILVGGVLLVTPGVLTDFFGLSLIAPPTRRFLAPRVKRWFMARAQVTAAGGGFGPGPAGPIGPGSTPTPKPGGGSPFEHPVV